MKRVNVTPLREVNGVKFGETRNTVRREFGRYTESKGYDDFKWCKVYYDRNNRMEAVELPIVENTIIVGSTNVDTSNLKSCQRGLGINKKIDFSRAISINENGSKVDTILFAKNKMVPIFEDASKDYEKELSDFVGPAKAKQQVENEQTQRDNYVNALKDADSKKPASDIEKAVGTPKQEEGSLSQYYDDLKNQLNSNPAGSVTNTIKVGPPISMMHHHPGHHAFMHMANQACDKLKDDCCKHILLDVYCKVHPLDKSYVNGNMGCMKSDIDNMLAAKGMNASQYLTSCSESTGAPLLKYILHSIDRIGNQFMEASKEKLKDAEENEAEVSTPEAPNIEEDENVSSQLVDVKKDTEYENFIDKLKEKTIKKIVGDVSKIINDKKEETEMEFDPKPASTDTDLPTLESTTSVALNYIQENFMRKGIEITEENLDEMVSMAIREATLNEINICFKQPETDLRRYTNRIRMGQGYVINESAVQTFIESVK